VALNTEAVNTESKNSESRKLGHLRPRLLGLISYPKCTTFMLGVIHIISDTFSTFLTPSPTLCNNLLSKITFFKYLYDEKCVKNPYLEVSQNFFSSKDVLKSKKNCVTHRTLFKISRII